MLFATASIMLSLAAAAPSDSPVTLQGIGPLRIGLSLAEIRRRFGAVSEYGPHPDGDCEYFRAPAFPGVSMMVQEGRVVRIDIDDPRYRTRSGAHVGMSERRIRAIYGRQMVVEEHPYTHPQGKYLVYEARSEPYSMIFETDNGRAISFRVGLADYVSLIEGCS
jgi:hypothetical protein